MGPGALRHAPKHGGGCGFAKDSAVVHVPTNSLAYFFFFFHLSEHYYVFSQSATSKRVACANLRLNLSSNIPIVLYDIL